MRGPHFGDMTPEMRGAISPHISGEVVWDLGAGNLWHSKMLVALGATEVIAVDKEMLPPVPDPRIHTLSCYFDAMPVPLEGISVAYLAWPINHHHIPGLEWILSRSRRVVYIGSNTNGSACGGPGLMEHLATRSVLAHIPGVRNSLIIYGEWAGERALLPEEWAALHPERMWTLEEATEAASVR